jgi:S-formylglutathione hydrolase FrmB
VKPPSPWSASQRGKLVKCAFDRRVSAEEMKQHFSDENVPAPSISTGAYRLRVAYWTEREQGKPALTSGVLYVPETRRAEPSPLVVAGHGSVGVADKCAPSREDPGGFLRDFRTQIYTLAGDGWVVLAPDFPGLGTEGAATWMFSPDEGHAMLDATRAARELAKEGFFSGKNAIVGHSNGGHAALSAQSYAKAYGTEGSVDAVVVWAPFWLSNGAWGALISTVGNTLITPAFLAMSMMYFHGHLAAYEGEDSTTSAFLPDKAQTIGDFLEGGCWQDVARKEKGPETIGLKKGSDAFVAAYTSEVGPCGLQGTCDSDLAKAWKARWAVDRPPPDPTIPIALWHGKKDDFLTPGYEMCGIDRLTGQGADLTVCFSEGGDHSSVITLEAGWVRSYLTAKLIGGEGPGACPGLDTFDPPLACSAPIPNSTDPAEP